MGRRLGTVMAATAAAVLCACGGATYVGTDGGGDGGGSSSSSSTSSSSGGSSGGGSSTSSGGSSSSSGGSSSSSGGGGEVPVNHRPNDAQCQTTPAPGDCTFGGQDPTGCTRDDQCTTGTNGRCTNDGPIAGCLCTYDACMQDTDCPTGQTCACHGAAYSSGAGNTCIQGNCRVDGDCGSDGYCSPAENSMSCGGVLGYYCHTAADLCVNDSDCGSDLQVCTYSTTAGHWECQMEGLCAL